MYLKKSLIVTCIILAFISLSFAVTAADEISQYADRLNYYSTSLSHTVNVSNTGTQGASVNITCPSDISFSSGSGCSSVTATIINCDVAASGSSSYTVTDSGSAVAEYTVSKCYVSSTNNTYTSQNNVSFLRVKDREIFHTLVEYGRGRGNYFFDTIAPGVAGSGHTGVGCSYVPNATMFELNFLHKVLNIKHWFGDLKADAYNATFSCNYPNSTVVRQHLITAIITNSSGA